MRAPRYRGGLDVLLSISTGNIAGKLKLFNVKIRAQCHYFFRLRLAQITSSIIVGAIAKYLDSELRMDSEIPEYITFYSHMVELRLLCVLTKYRPQPTCRRMVTSVHGWCDFSDCGCRGVVIS